MLHAVDRRETSNAAVSPARPARGFKIGLVALAAALTLAGCNDDGGAGKTASAPAQPSANPAEAPQPAVVQAAYTPPSADVLYQMVAPIALYPDKLVAQILAGSTYPDQVSAAEAWLAQNPGLKGPALSNAANVQPWDPSIKSLTLFPNVLGQMASNLPWTTALGKAYYNDPADVMNAIQVMRSRAYKAGSLKNSSHLKVKLVTDAQPVENYTPADVMPAMPVSAPVIAPPPEFIEIAPSEPSTVYVPQYNPAVVYGDPMPIYGGYSYVTAPPPVVVGSVATPVVAGLIGFGVGIAVTEVIDHPRPWGWDSWRVHWGEPGRPGYWREGDRPPPPLARPAVVYNHQTYVSNSTTVVENIRNVNNVRVTNNVFNNPPRGDAGHQPAQALATPPGQGPAFAAGAAMAGAAAAGGYAFAHRQPPQSPGSTPNMQPGPGGQQPMRPGAFGQAQPTNGQGAFPGQSPANQPQRGLSMAQQLARQPSSPVPPDQARQQQVMQQHTQQQTQEQARQQQLAQQRTQDQARSQQMTQQRVQQEQVRQQQMAQQRTQQEQAAQQQRAHQEQMHQQQMAQQRTQQEQAAQQQRAQQEQMRQQQIAQQRAQQEQAAQQQRAQQAQMHQQQMAQQRAQQEQAAQQQRAQQEQMHQQQMAQQRAQQEQMRQQAQQQAMQRAQQEQMRQQQQQMSQQAHQQQAFHPQQREGRHGNRQER